MIKKPEYGIANIKIEEWEMDICCLTDIALDFLKAANNYYEKDETFSIYLYGKADEKDAIITSFDNLITIIDIINDNNKSIETNTTINDFIKEMFEDIKTYYKEFEDFVYQEDKTVIAYQNRCKEMKNEFDKLNKRLN